MDIKHLFSLLSLSHTVCLVKFQLTSIQEIESARQSVTFETSKAKEQGRVDTSKRIKSKKDLD